VTEAVHQRGGRIFVQLWHRGRQSHPALMPNGVDPLAPSARQSNGISFLLDGSVVKHSMPRALETSELPGIVEEFRHAARMAKWANFDGVELHGANGYLIEQFLSDDANRRTDRYGGSVENRARLLLEVVDALCTVWPSNQVGVRLSPGNTFGGIYHGDCWGTYSYSIQQLASRQLGYIHLVEPAANPGQDMDRSYVDLVASHRFRPLITGRTRLIAAGGYDLQKAESVVQEGMADLVAFGRSYLANPDLDVRFAQHAPLNTPNPGTFYKGGKAGYIDYPKLAHANAS